MLLIYALLVEQINFYFFQHIHTTVHVFKLSNYYTKIYISSKFRIWPSTNLGKQHLKLFQFTNCSPQK